MASCHPPVSGEGEKRTKRRWEWATNPWLSACSAFSSFCWRYRLRFDSRFQHASGGGIFIIALGLVEKDGLVVIAGALIGLAAVAVLGAVVFGLFALF